jgi:hypothetical protein
MSKNEQVELLSGNIHTESNNLVFVDKDKGFQSTKYFFTYHIQKNETFEQAFKNLEGLQLICKKYVFAEEYGKSGKTPHIQGAMILQYKKRAKTLENDYFLNGVSLFKLKNWKHAFDYCCKEGVRVISSEKIAKPLKIISSLYNYQLKIYEILKGNPNDRDILWIFGTYNVGKTALCKYLVHNKVACGPLEGTKKHMLSVVAENLNETCFIIYLTADESNFQKRSLFEVIEKVKDGFFMSHFGTDGTKPVIMNSPHILVFGNRPPDMSRTMMDPNRFKVWEITDKDMINSVEHLEDIDVSNLDEGIPSI